MNTHWTLIAFAAGLIFSAGLLVHGALVVMRGAGPPASGPRGIRRVVCLIYGGRSLLAGIALVGLVLGLMKDSGTLVNLSLVFGLEELYETTMALYFLRRIERNEAAAFKNEAADKEGPHPLAFPTPALA